MTEFKIKNLLPIENDGKRILLTSQLAELYETDEKRISENFTRNEQRYIKNEDYFCLQGDELRAFKRETANCGIASNLNKLYLWTEHGALLHAKSLGTNEAWRIYGELVDTYFKVQEQKKFSAIEMMKLQSQAIFELDERIDTLEDIVENQRTLDCGKQRTLQNTVSKRAYERAGQVFPKDIKQNVGRFFSAIYKDLKNRFGVASYRDINVNDYTNAIQYVGAWIEPSDVRNEVS